MNMEHEKRVTEYDSKTCQRCSRKPWNRKTIFLVLRKYRVVEKFYPKVMDDQGKEARVLKLCEFHAWRHEHHIHHPSCPHFFDPSPGKDEETGDLEVEAAKLEAEKDKVEGERARLQEERARFEQEKADFEASRKEAPVDGETTEAKKAKTKKK